MRNFLLSCITSILVSFSIVSGYSLYQPTIQYHKTDFLEELVETSCVVYHLGGHGSGTLVTRRLKIDGVEKDYNFVITCGHIVDQLVVDGVMDDSFLFGKIVNYKGGELGQERTFKLKVLKFSDRFNKDIAILLAEEEVTNKSPKFSLTRPKVGEEVWHLGAPMDRELISSILHGHISAITRVNIQEYEQIQCGVIGGCSGGGVFNARGEFIGMAARTLGESYGFMVPVRIIRSWLKEEGMGWILEGECPENLEDCL